MADSKISALTSAATPLAGTEVLPIVQSSTTKKVAVSDLTAGRSVSALNYVVTGTSVPANGIYSSSANALTFATNSTLAGVIDWAQNMVIGLNYDTVYIDSGGTQANPRVLSYKDSTNTNRATEPPLVTLLNGDANYTAGRMARLSFAAKSSGAGYIHSADITAVYPSSAASNGVTSYLDFGTTDASVSQQPTVKWRIDETGNLIQKIAAKGIDFSANTPAAGKTSTLLNWYEEGTWTPIDNSGASLSLTVAYAKYTRIGRQVTINAYLTYPSTSSTASASLGGLPFTVASDNYAPFTIVSNSGTALSCNANALSTTFSINTAADYGSAVKNVTLSTKGLIVSGAYFV